MSFIKFESSRVKEEERRSIREAREKVLDKAKKDYIRRKEEEIQAKLRGDDKWMLPSVESRLAGESDKKKHKKKRKKKKKKSKSKRHSSSSSSESDSEEEWVEKESSPKKGETEKRDSVKEGKPVLNEERDEWMSLPGMFPCFSRQELKKSKVKDEKADESKIMLDKPGQSSRELNPYWKDGGTGLPEEKPDDRGARALGGVGDKGADWLRRALRRAKEQAEEEGRTLEDIAQERWGSLEKLQSMIREAEERERGKRSYGNGPSAPRNFHLERERGRGESLGRREGGRPSVDSRYHGLSSSRGLFRKPAEADDEDGGEGSSRSFRKPDQDYDWRSRSGGSSSGSRSKGGSGNWRKRDPEKKEEAVQGGGDVRARRELPSSEGSSSSDSEGGEGKEVKKTEGGEEEKLLTDQEMNELGAKLVKAEILGNEGLVKELKAKLERAREMRKKLVASVGEGVKDRGSGDSRRRGEEEEVVVLSRTTSKGFARPVGGGGDDGGMVWGGRKKKGSKVDTHVDGKRVRYFADDDKYSLKEMFEREKLNTVEDSNEMFSKLASKGVGRPESVNDMDDIFEESARFTKSMEREKDVERGRAIAEHHKVTKALDNCQWCLDSKLMLKHLIVAIGTKAYLCLPGHQSLTEGHCMIVPMSHLTCGTAVDEDVWAEIQEFRKGLTKMFLAMDQDCVFFETAINLKRFPHMVLECVPMEKEIGDLAPIYFKKAIQECEMEWSNNKKVVDLVNKDVRRAIPKGLPYFSVDFGLQSGFAHVIEDERQWPMNFAQEIIGGMLDLDHRLWKKKRPENFDQQRKKVVQFSKWWKEYDWTQKLKETN
ncbi:CWF19-like protein 2 [Ischnura elegans]|uniref:CWF19-like protein 2 n=1 Tax=Ischnura elegans TaxID=197161 RepID=UPI001ED8950A|nr:CWF19-like protein 2 [Ischnura elegans]